VTVTCCRVAPLAVTLLGWARASLAAAAPCAMAVRSFIRLQYHQQEFTTLYLPAAAAPHMVGDTPCGTATSTPCKCAQPRFLSDSCPFIIYPSQFQVAPLKRVYANPALGTV
jgi:hypothetical protein